MLLEFGFHSGIGMFYFVEFGLNYANQTITHVICLILLRLVLVIYIAKLICF
ncbi:hypothetical protein Hanom_Chr15g01368521 [Helianthus anomalus]